MASTVASVVVNVKGDPFPTNKNSSPPKEPSPPGGASAVDAVAASYIRRINAKVAVYLYTMDAHKVVTYIGDKLNCHTFNSFSKYYNDDTMNDEFIMKNAGRRSNATAFFLPYIAIGTMGTISDINKIVDECHSYMDGGKECNIQAVIAVARSSISTIVERVNAESTRYTEAETRFANAGSDNRGEDDDTD